MKKTILAILMAMMTTTAFAEGKCEGGYVFEGVIDGHEYCISEKTMTWWSAFEWCQQQGRHLASLQEAYGDLYGAWGDAACGNMIKSGVTAKICWTAKPSGSAYVYLVSAGRGEINDHAHSARNNTFSALCY